MSTRWKKMIDDLYLPGTSAAHYTVATGLQAAVTSIILCNTDSSPVTVTIYIMKSGGTEAKGTILSAYSMAVGETKTLPLGGEVMDVGDAIKGFASVADKVTIRASGYERNV